jgi:N-acetyl-gamma-glutamyl-phosphate reductase
LFGTYYDDLTLVEPKGLAGRADAFLCAAQHGAAMGMARELLSAGAKVVDLSADFRLADPALFERWYQPHADPGLLAEAVYGLPELYRERIARASLVANPGCYPTSVILALAPLLSAGLVDLAQILVADSKSGVSGAGRVAALGYSFCEVEGNFRSYKTVGHRHTPEIVQELSRLAGAEVRLAFTPHLVPINRGILTTVYLKLARPMDLESLREAYRRFYLGSPFVRVRRLGQNPETADVRGTNLCDLALFHDPDSGLHKIISVIDNLCRGAAGQAVANLNLMTGRPETHGLTLAPVRP